MNKLYGLPILIGFIASYLYPDYAFEMSSYPLYLLFILSALTSTRYQWVPLNKVKQYGFAIIFCYLFSYGLTLPIVNFLCHIFELSDSYRMSLLLVSCAPFALIAPLFVRKFSGDTQLSQLLIMTSALATPIITYCMFIIFDNKGLSAYSIEPISRVLSIVVTIMLLTIFITHFFKYFSTESWFKIQSYGSSFIISCLVYIFWGQSWPTLSHRSTDLVNISIIIFILIFFDFGIFFALRTISKTIEDNKYKAMRITLSMKNMAIPATLIATYSPNNLFIPAIGFACHILFFNYLALIKKI